MQEDVMKDIKVPIRCPFCGYLMKGKSTNTWYDWKCCMDCYIEFIESREDRWKSGWRPTQEQIDSYLVKIREDQ